MQHHILLRRGVNHEETWIYIAISVNFKITGNTYEQSQVDDIYVSQIVTDTQQVIQQNIEEVVDESATSQLYETNFHSIMSCDWDADDSYLLAKIAMAEAEGEDTEGKAYVIMVILNRILSDEFPDTIEDVIFQDNQFSPVSNGRFYNIEPNDDCWDALDMIQVDKWDKSQGALYFESCESEDNWHSRNLVNICLHTVNIDSINN